MRYYTERPENSPNTTKYLYKCNHPLYSACTLLKKGDKGIAIVQLRFNSRLKHFWYGPIETYLAEAIFSREGFFDLMSEKGAEPKDGLYPTMNVRKIMWALKMKPLRKEPWESQDFHIL